MTEAEKKRREAYRAAMEALDEGCQHQPELVQALAVVRDERKNMQNLLHKARESREDARRKLSELRGEQKAEAARILHSDGTTIKLKGPALKLIEASERRKRGGWRQEVADKGNSGKGNNLGRDFIDHARSNCNQGN